MSLPTNIAVGERFAHLTYVAPTSQIAFTAVPKSGCTSFLWLLAELEGSLNTDIVTLTPELTRDQAIHDVEVSGLRRLSSLTASQIDEIRTSAEWIRLTLVRNPYERLVSAWTDRAVLKQQMDGYDTDLAVTTRSLARSFQDFTSLLAETPSLLSDDHLCPQSEFADAPNWHFDFVFRLEQIANDIKYLQNLPRFTSIPQLRRLNESLGLRAIDVFDEISEANAFEIYERDFSKLRYERMSFSTPSERVLTDLEVILVRHLKMRNERLKDLSNQALVLDEEIRRANGARYAARVIQRRIGAELRNRAQKYRLLKSD